MPESASHLSLMEGQQLDGYCETYVTPDVYWQGNAALNYSRALFTTQPITVSLWAWCTQLDYYSQAETQAYLDAMGAQLEAEFPAITFVYMTGNAQSAEQNRYDRNNQIRTYLPAKQQDPLRLRGSRLLV